MEQPAGPGRKTRGMLITDNEPAGVSTADTETRGKVNPLTRQPIWLQQDLDDSQRRFSKAIPKINSPALESNLPD